MRFSQYYGIEASVDHPWFDPILTIDTPLFLDPFLVYAQERAHFEGSHNEIIGFFNGAFRLVARSGGDPSSPHYRKALNLLRFPEVAELCIGYTSGGTKGSGSGKEVANVVAQAMWEAVTNGMVELRHFEEIALFREGFGPDRISDATAGLLRRRLAAYTTELCEQHGVPTEPARYVRGWYDADAEIWLPLDTQLPRNPDSGRPVLLAPRAYLNSLPTINPDDFWDYCWANDSELIRAEFNYDISRRVSKREIIAVARRHPELRQAYMADVEQRLPLAYDTNRDPKGLLLPYDNAAAYSREHPLPLVIERKLDFVAAIDAMVQEYCHFAEQGGGWRLLWNDNFTPRLESAAQRLFQGMVGAYCRANDIDLSKEADVGCGTVDFKASKGYTHRTHIEIKLARNSHFWDGLTSQLPAYMQSDGVDSGYFIAIAYSDGDLRRMSGLRQAAASVSETITERIKVVVVDARRKTSASRLRTHRS